MTDTEKKEHVELIGKWNATDITREQTERLEQLDAIATLAHRTSIPESARNDREEIIHAAREELRIKYDHGQHEHRTDLPSGGLGWFINAAREEALDLMAYTHHLKAKSAALHDLHEQMETHALTLDESASALWEIISETPPRKHPNS
jgi:hypothetical protein